MNIENISWLSSQILIFKSVNLNIDSKIHFVLYLLKIKNTQKQNFNPKIQKWYKFGFWKPEQNQNIFSYLSLSSLFLFLSSFPSLSFSFSLPKIPSPTPDSTLIGPDLVSSHSDKAPLTYPDLAQPSMVLPLAWNRTKRREPPLLPLRKARLLSHLHPRATIGPTSPSSCPGDPIAS